MYACLISPAPVLNARLFVVWKPVLGRMGFSSAQMKQVPVPVGEVLLDRLSFDNRKSELLIKVHFLNRRGYVLMKNVFWCSYWNDGISFSTVN